MKKFYLLLMLSILFQKNLVAQLTNDNKFFIGNVISSGIICSVNACINKSNNQSLGKTIINSFWKGCLGGVLNYGGKKLIEESSFQNSYKYIWPGRIIHSIGSSITYNGSKNQKLLSSFNIDILFLNVNISDRLKCRIDPITIGYSGILLFNKDFKFNFKNSLLTGSMFFDKKSDDFIVDGGEIDLFQTSGEAIGNTIWRKINKQYFYDFYTQKIKIDGEYYNSTVVNKTIKIFDKNVVCHEIIHTLQYNQYNVFNSIYIDKINNNLLKNIFYININFGIIYYAVNLNGYNKNYFEKEASYFGKSDFFSNNSAYH
jgi:hypothetical protein